jgi:hypothetical protein
MVPDLQHPLVIMVIGHPFYCELQRGIFFSRPPLTVVHKTEANPTSAVQKVVLLILNELRCFLAVFLHYILHRF